MTGDRTAITNATTSARIAGSSTAKPTIRSTLAANTPSTPCAMVRRRRQFHSFPVKNFSM